MKLCISEPVLVAQGPDSRTSKWGSYQFPHISRLADGRFLCRFNSGADSEAAYGGEPTCSISDDEGKTWTPARYSEYNAINGMRLQNGDLIRFATDPSVPLEGLKLPAPIGPVTNLGMTAYNIDEVDESICPRGWILYRRKTEDPQPVREVVKLNWPHMIVRSCRGVFVPPSTRGRLRMAPDGTLWMPHYYLAGTDPETGEYIPKLCNYLFKSTDYGKTWDLVTFLPYYPDEAQGGIKLERYEGFGENDITFLPDGSMIRLIRTNTIGPCYYTRSEDGGKTWSNPTVFDKNGVWPCLLTLKCGVTLATYGRPGISLRATTDPAGKQWEDPIKLLEASPKKTWTSLLDITTCAYTDLIALGDNVAGLVYSDFTQCDEEGVPHKCIMFRTITVKD